MYGIGFPRRFGKYWLLASLGRGGMGEVYAAAFAGGLDGIEKRCVIKTLHPDVASDPEHVTRFLDEARVAVRLSQRNICQVFDAGVIDGHHFLAMELVRGRDLRAIQRRAAEQGARISEALAVHIVAEVLDGLHYAHELVDDAGRPLSIIHRDVSPQNIMVSVDGDVKLIDFGLAASTIKVEQTERNVVMGKMAYMTPEQARGERADASADVFACGVVLYELLTSARYYEGIAAMHLTGVVAGGAHQPGLLSTLDPALVTILRHALQPERKARMSSAGQLAAALRVWAQARGLHGDAAQLRAFMRALFGDARPPWEGLSIPQADAPSANLGPDAHTAPRHERDVEGPASGAVTAGVTLTERVPDRARDAPDARATHAAQAAQDTGATAYTRTGDTAQHAAERSVPLLRRRPRTVAAAMSLVAVLALVALARVVLLRSPHDDGCARTIRVHPVDARSIPAGTTIRVSLPRFPAIPLQRQRSLLVQTSSGDMLPRHVDVDEQGELSVVVLLPEVPVEGLELRASACGEPPADAPVASVYALHVDGTDAIHWQTRCGDPTTDAETCRLSRLPEGPRDALQAILRATCRVDPYDGYSMDTERLLNVPPGTYAIEGSWTTTAVLYDYCGGPGASTGGSLELAVNGQAVAQGPQAQTGGTPGRECEADLEYQPSNTRSASLSAQVELRGNDRLGLAVRAGDCALVTAQVRLGLRRVAVPAPHVGAD